MRTSVLLASLVLVVLAGDASSGWQTGRPLPNEQEFLEAVRKNLARAQQEQNQYAYMERRTELHMNPFGRLGTGATSVYEVIPGDEPRVTMRRLVERDGKAVPDSKPERQERRARQGRSVVDDAVATLEFEMDRREIVDGRETIVVRFRPRPNARPETREGRIAKVFTGSIWIDEAAREVFSVEATAIDDISFGFGLIARLNEGTRVTLSRERVDASIWLPTSLRFVGEGRAILFRKLAVDHVIEWFDYRKVR